MTKKTTRNQQYRDIRPTLFMAFRWGRPESARTYFATARIQYWVTDHNTIGTDRSFIRGLSPESDIEPPAADITKEVNEKGSLTTTTT
jgi:hypothetical protein